MAPWICKTLVIASAAAACAGLYVWHFLTSERMGAAPSGKILERIEASPNYRDGQFRNKEPFELKLVEAPESRQKGWLGMLFPEKGDTVPLDPVPTVKTDLKNLPRGEDVLVWLGHSGYFIQAGGVRILIDPVLGSAAAPVPFAVRAFEGSRIYAIEDFPDDIDLLLVSHDHWDHLEYETILALRDKAKFAVVPLGVDAHLAAWGWNEKNLISLDWDETAHLAVSGGEASVTATVARHFSGRLFEKNKTLWSGFAVKAGGRSVYYSGDGSFGVHFADIAQSYGPFDLAIIECGQYDPAWPWAHMTPEESAEAMKTIGAARSVPAHNGKYSISYHQWRDPLERITEAAGHIGVNLATPMIGEKFDYSDPEAQTTKWWEGRK